MLKQILITLAILLFTCAVFHLVPLADLDSQPVGTGVARCALPGISLAR